MAEPVTVPELKANLDIVRDDQDIMLAGYIVAGRCWVEQHIHRSLVGGVAPRDFLTPNDVPASLKAAIIIYAQSIYETRTLSPEVIATLESLCDGLIKPVIA